MSKLSRLTAVMVLVLVSVFSCQAWAYSGGDGSAAIPYEINTVADLTQLAGTTGDYGKYFKLTANIDLAGQAFDRAVIAPDADLVADAYQGNGFRGSFNGNGYKILNLNY